jgi:hypothetical protein
MELPTESPTNNGERVSNESNLSTNPQPLRSDRDEGSAAGHVTVNERIPSQRFTRFVDQQIKNWIREHEIDRFTTEYEVAFFDEESLGEVSCLVVVQSGTQLWRAWESADNSRAALMLTMEHLKFEEHGTDPSAGFATAH